MFKRVFSKLFISLYFLKYYKSIDVFIDSSLSNSLLSDGSLTHPFQDFFFNYSIYENFSEMNLILLSDMSINQTLLFKQTNYQITLK